MEIGVFIPIGNNGWLISETAPQYRPSFELNKTITQAADRYGFDFALSMIKLRGFGGKTETIDLDASCVMFDDANKPVDIVWFRQLKSRDGSIVHTGELEAIKVTLSGVLVESAMYCSAL